MIAADELKFARLLPGACMVEQITVDCGVRAVAKGGRNVLKGECRSARLRDDDEALRPRVDSAILVFAIEPISIQTGSRKGAERLNKVRSGWEEGEYRASQMNARHETEDGDGCCTVLEFR